MNEWYQVGGVGDIAESFEQLGTQVEVDACCRAHDHCPVKLKAFRTGYGLINLSLYTKSHCDCDREFFSCLKTSRNKVADVVGNFYFNIMKIQCLKEHRPFVCIENRTETDGMTTCIKWGEDPESKKMHTTVTHLRY
ncbi:acidic phospholipase A2 PA4 [Caerostris extrusa]|uniref:Acidic phospholipase A2 PA4 n=1 Tax=Caerostris extrusa TaxID=172846 RepID=A0AAV4RXV5_CAEEX|nr:acidic phospholipase A2 PA4 [Caerostris extrusa]